MSVPKRIQRRRTKGWRMPADAVYVGRPTLFGNPFVIGAQLSSAPWEHRVDPHPARVEDATHAVALYRAWILEGATYPRTGFGPHGHAKFIEDIYALRGHDLACWCPLDQPCHADVLLDVANP